MSSSKKKVSAPPPTKLEAKINMIEVKLFRLNEYMKKLNKETIASESAQQDILKSSHGWAISSPADLFKLSKDEINKVMLELDTFHSLKRVADEKNYFQDEVMKPLDQFVETIDDILTKCGPKRIKTNSSSVPTTAAPPPQTTTTTTTVAPPLPAAAAVTTSSSPLLLLSNTATNTSPVEENGKDIVTDDEFFDEGNDSSFSDDEVNSVSEIRPLQPLSLVHGEMIQHATNVNELGPILITHLNKYRSDKRIAETISTAYALYASKHMNMSEEELEWMIQLFEPLIYVSDRDHPDVTYRVPAIDPQSQDDYKTSLVKRVCFLEYYSRMRTDNPVTAYNLCWASVKKQYRTHWNICQTELLYLKKWKSTFKYPGNFPFKGMGSRMLEKRLQYVREHMNTEPGQLPTTTPAEYTPPLFVPT